MKSSLLYYIFITVILINNHVQRISSLKHNSYTAAAAAKSLQSCPTLCDPIDSSPPGSPIPGILQARTLEWVAISFSNAWKWKVKVKLLIRVWLLVTSWTAAYQAPPMGFSRQQYWSGVPLPSPETRLLDMKCSREISQLNFLISHLPQLRPSRSPDVWATARGRTKLGGNQENSNIPQKGCLSSCHL